MVGRKRVYCDDDCSRKYHARDKTNRLKAEKKKLPVRFCKYEECGKQLSSEDFKKSYCRNTDCYRKQNVIDNKLKYQLRKNNKETIKKCENIKCQKTFKMDINRSSQKYCSEDCRTEVNTKKCPYCPNIIKKISNSCRPCAVKNRKEGVKKRGKAKEIFKIPKEFLERGTIQYEGHA